MSKTMSQAFTEFSENIAITEYQKTSIVEGRMEVVKKTLTDAFPSTGDLPFVWGKLIGSAAKGTIVRPMDDIDVLAFFSNKDQVWNTQYRFDSQKFLYRVKRAYGDGVDIDVGARGQTIRIFFQTGGHVDVAPVFRESADKYIIPAGDGSWLPTSPLLGTQWYLDKNKALGSNLTPLVRLLKKWNQNHSKRLRSFHLETIAANVFSSLSSNPKNGLLRFFEWAPGALNVEDPGGQSGILSTYLNQFSRSEVMKSLDLAHDRVARAIEAEEKDKMDDAFALWQMVLGPDFPNA